MGVQHLGYLLLKCVKRLEFAENEENGRCYGNKMLQTKTILSVYVLVKGLSPCKF
jgi:hypothetical protein